MSSTVDNEFMLSLLQLCGPIKSWKRPQDPAHGTLKSFGFCEFESAEGVLRALRLLNKLNLDGQELVINVNQATREYLERYVKKKSENINVPKETGSDGTDKSEENAAKADSEPPKSDSEDLKKDEKDSGAEEKNDASSFGIVTDDEREADRLSLEKLTDMLEERLKNNPLPPPPPPPLPKPADGFGNSNSEHPASSRDGEADVDIMKHDGLEGKNEDEITSDNKPTNEHDRPETSSPDKGARHDRRGRDKDRDQKREKERELERYEREREQERTRREKERENKVKDDERRYKARVKDWEYREREKELLRKQEKEKENNRAIKRKREVLDQEYDDGDGDSKRRKHRSSGTEERRRRLREKEEDMEDQLKEEEEIAEAKRKAEEEMRQKKEREKDVPEISPNNTNHKSVSPHEVKDMVVDETSDGDIGHQNHIGEGMVRNGNGDDSITGQVAASDTRQNSNVLKKLGLGFGLVGSGKRTAVPSVFSEDEDENAQKEKKMRPLVPIDYSTEEVQAVQSTTVSSPPSNLAAAAEFAKRISSGTPKEDRPDVEKERSRPSHDRYNQGVRDRNDDDSSRTRDSSRTGERNIDRDRDIDRKLKAARQLIDMIPKTKDELFSYEINWAVYDKNELHNRLRPWIAKNISEFSGEEETTMVDCILSSMRKHVKASEMLDMLQSTLYDESEMFVLKMWRMLIFEIKKIETGLALILRS